PRTPTTRIIPPAPATEPPRSRRVARLAAQEPQAPPRGRRLLALTLTALGVVYGDIGTSPLYALRECFDRGAAPAPADVLGVLSLIVWALALTVSLKYLVLVLRADNHGEGGIL